MKLSFTMLLLICFIIFFSAIAHGIIGFAFPLIATSLVVLFIDIKIAVALTVLPNLIVNVLSIYRGKLDFTFLKTFWPVAIYVMIGTVIGTKALLYFHEDALKLLLVAIIFIYLLQDRFKRFSLIKILSHKPYSRALFSLLAGFFSGSVSTGSVPLVLYYVSIQYPPLLMTQVLNASFAGSKVIQFVTLELAGGFETIPWSFLLLINLLSVLGLFLGIKTHKQVSTTTYYRLLRGFLTAIGFLLLFQILWHR
jgi:uncharacterized protein